MRRCGAAQQRVWLGPGGYFCRRERRITNANANANAYSDGDRHRNTHRNRNPNGNSYAHAYRSSSPDAAAAAYAGVQALEIFAAAKISSYR